MSEAEEVKEFEMGGVMHVTGKGRDIINKQGKWQCVSEVKANNSFQKEGGNQFTELSHS